MTQDWINYGTFEGRTYRAWHMPLPNSLRQVKLPIRQIDLNNVFFYILYKQIKKMQGK